MIRISTLKVHISTFYIIDLHASEYNMLLSAFYFDSINRKMRITNEKLVLFKFSDLRKALMLNSADTSHPTSCFQTKYLNFVLIFSLSHFSSIFGKRIQRRIVVTIIVAIILVGTLTD